MRRFVPVPAASLLFACAAQAQDYPAKPIRLLKIEDLTGRVIRLETRLDMLMGGAGAKAYGWSPKKKG